MINTDKYEGHQVSEFKTSVAGPNHSWVTHKQKYGYVESLFVKHATAALVLDAPLLLEEVKRLRKKLFEAELWVNNDSYTFENDMKELNDYAEAMEE